MGEVMTACQTTQLSASIFFFFHYFFNQIDIMWREKDEKEASMVYYDGSLIYDVVLSWILELIFS